MPYRLPSLQVTEEDSGGWRELADRAGSGSGPPGAQGGRRAGLLLTLTLVLQSSMLWLSLPKQRAIVELQARGINRDLDEADPAGQVFPNLYTEDVDAKPAQVPSGLLGAAFFARLCLHCPPCGLLRTL